jgi:hypothetical protein
MKIINLLSIKLINLFSLWAFVWFLLYYLKFIKFNPSILYVFLFIPITYLLIKTIIKRKNDKDKILIIICFTLIDIFPIVYLVLTNDIKLEFRSFVLALTILTIYLFYIKYNSININQEYYNHLFSNKYLIK